MGDTSAAGIRKTDKYDNQELPGIQKVFALQEMKGK